MSSPAIPRPHTVLSPMSVPVVPCWLAQSIAPIVVVPTVRPSCSMTHRIRSLASSARRSHACSVSSETPMRKSSRAVTSGSANQSTMTAASSSRGGRRRNWLPWMIGPYIAAPNMPDGSGPVKLSVGRFGQLDAELPGGALDLAHRRALVLRADALDLVEPGRRVADVLGVDQRLLALLRKRERAVGKLVALLLGQVCHALHPTSSGACKVPAVATSGRLARGGAVWLGRAVRPLWRSLVDQD